MDNFLSLEPTTASTTDVKTTEASSPTNSAQIGGSFIDSLPEELRSSPSLEKFKGKQPADVVKSYLELEKFVGGSVKIPSADAKPEDMKVFMEKVQVVPGITYLNPEDESSVKNVLSKLGLPETSDKYDLGEVQEGITEDVIKNFKDTSHKLGLTNNQAKAVALALRQNREGHEAQQVAQAEATLKSAEVQLQKEWGLDYKSKITSAQETFKVYQDKFPNEAKLLKDTAGNNPLVLRMLADMHGSLKERSQVQGSGTGTIGMSVEQAMRRKKEILDSDRRTHPYYNLRHPDHDKFVKEIDSLYDIISPASKS